MLLRTSLKGVQYLCLLFKGKLPHLTKDKKNKGYEY